MTGVRTFSRTALALALSTLPLAGCASIDRFLGGAATRPELPLPGAYSQASPGSAVPDAWWTLFGDDALDRLIEEALAGNQDLAAAAARVDEARALAGFARAERLPEVTADASAAQGELSRKGAGLPAGFPLDADRYRIGVGIRYDLDFWGRYRRASEAARQELLATEEAARVLRLAVATEVASAWFDLLALDHQRAIAAETLASRQESVRLQKARFDAGSISELDLAQAEGELAATEATLPAFERAIRRTEDRLAVLLGRFGGRVAHEERALDGPVLPEIPVGLPSDLLARRPDLRAAERSLAAADARIGVARTGYLPTIALTGSLGSESRELSDLLSSGTSAWQAALGLLQPIWNAGRTRRQVEAATARRAQALAAYTKSAQGAFAEVEDALAARATGAVERAALARQVEALDRAHRLADLRYEAGESSYFEVLDAERSLFRAQLDLATARRGELDAAVALFRALGGGWQPPARPAEDDASAAPLP